MSIMYPKHKHHSFSSWSGTLQISIASDLSDPAVQQNVLQTINVSEVLTIQFLLESSS